MNVLEWAVSSVLGSKLTQSTGAIDVIAIRKDDGTMSCSPFHVKLGKVSKKGERRVVTLKVNGKEVSLLMKLGPAGEAFFVERSKEFIRSRETVLISTSSPNSYSDIIPHMNKDTNSANTGSMTMAMLSQVTSFSSFPMIVLSNESAGQQQPPHYPTATHCCSDIQHTTTVIGLKSRTQRSLSESEIIGSTPSLQSVATNENLIIEKELNHLELTTTTTTIASSPNIISSDDYCEGIIAIPPLERRRRSISDMSGLLGTVERAASMGSELFLSKALPQIENQDKSFHGINELNTEITALRHESVPTVVLSSTINNPIPVQHPKEESVVSWIWQWGALPVKSKSKSYNDLVDVAVAAATSPSPNAGATIVSTIDDTHIENINSNVHTGESSNLKLLESYDSSLTMKLSSNDFGSRFPSMNSTTIGASSPVQVWNHRSLSNSPHPICISRSSPLLPSIQKQHQHQLDCNNEKDYIHTISTFTNNVNTNNITLNQPSSSPLTIIPAMFPLIYDLSKNELSKSGKVGIKGINSEIIDKFNPDQQILAVSEEIHLKRSMKPDTTDSFELQIEAVEGSLSRLPSFPSFEHNNTEDNLLCDSIKKKGYELEWRDSFSDIHQIDISLSSERIDIEKFNIFENKNITSPDDSDGYDIGTGYISSNRESPYNEILNSVALSGADSTNEKYLKVVPTYIIDSKSAIISKRDENNTIESCSLEGDEEGTTTTDNDNLSLQDIDLEDISPEPAGGDFYDSDTDSYLSLSLEDGESGLTQHNRENISVFSRSEKFSSSKTIEDNGGSISSTENRRRYKKYRYRKVLVPTQDQLNMLGLHDGENEIEFHLEGCVPLKSQLFVWPPDAKIVVTDLEGICTTGKQSNARNTTGVWVSFLGGGSYYSSAIASKNKEIDNCIRLFAGLHRQGYRVIYISQSTTSTPYLLSSKDYLSSIKASTGECLPPGPIFKSPESLVRAFGASRTDVFKAAALRGVKSLFSNNYNPYHACFCTRESDAIPFARFGFPEGRIFLINEKNEINNANRTFKLDFARMNELIQEIFPQVIDNQSRTASKSTVRSSVDDSYNDFNYWKIPYAIIEDGDEY